MRWVGPRDRGAMDLQEMPPSEPARAAKRPFRDRCFPAGKSTKCFVVKCELGPSADLELRAWSLRFRDNDLEESFWKSLIAETVEATGRLGCATILVYALYFSIEFPHGKFINSDRVVHSSITFGAEACLCLLGSVLAGLAYAQRRHKLFSFTMFEVFLVFSFMLAMVFFTLTEDRFVTYMVQQGPGIDPKHLYSPYRSLPLAICLLVVITHAWLPLRTSAMWPLQLLALVWNASAHLLTKHAGIGGIANNLTLTMVVIVAVCGKRPGDAAAAPRLFQIMVTERALRARSEAERAEARLGRPRLVDASNAQESPALPAGEFPVERPPTNIVKALKLLADKGREERWLMDAGTLGFAPSFVVAHGRFGTVLPASLRGAPVALKLSAKPLRHDIIDRAPAILADLRALRQLSHPNLATFHGVVVDPVACEIGIVMELVQGPRLDAFVSKPDEHGVTDLQRFQVAQGLAHALLYLHGRSPPVVHGELQPSGIAVELGRWAARAKLTDFGMSCVRPRMGLAKSCSLAWAAPELLQASVPCSCADAWGQMAASTESMTSWSAGIKQYRQQQCRWNDTAKASKLRACRKKRPARRDDGSTSSSLPSHSEEGEEEENQMEQQVKQGDAQRQRVGPTPETPKMERVCL